MSGSLSPQIANHAKTYKSQARRRYTCGAMLGHGPDRDLPMVPERAFSSARTASAMLSAGALVASLVIGAACGARSGDPPPDDATETETETETGTDSETGTETDGTADPPLGSCENPIVLPLKQFTVRGRLLGPSEQDGWCSDGENDRGAEDVYRVTAPYDVDVYFIVRDETDFEPVIRVEKDICGAGEDLDEDGTVRMCTNPLATGAIRSFFLEANAEYFITVDSPRGVDGRYGLDILYGPPPVEACALHPSVITQQPGGVFLWENELPAGQGFADGPCGGPGTENIFALEIDYPGVAAIDVDGDVNADIRSYCGGTGELVCEQNGGYFEYFFESPGTYYLNVDQPSHTSANSYSLRVEFD